MRIPISTSGIGNIDTSNSNTAKARSKKDDQSIDTFSSLMNMASATKNNKYDISNENNSDNKTDAIPKTSYKKEFNTDITKDTRKKIMSDKDNSDISGQEDDSSIECDEILAGIEAVICDKLNITEEELEGLLQSMNLNLEDLTDAANLKSFILDYKELTNLDLLINEELTDLIDSTENQIICLLEEYNITDSDEFIKLVKDIEIQDEQVLVNETADKSPLPDIIESETELSQENIDKAVYSEIQSDDIAFTDVKYQSTDTKQESKDFSKNGQSMMEIAQNLNQAIENAFADNGIEEVTDGASEIPETDIVRQIIDDIKINMTSEVNSIEIQLNPEHLGKVHINVSSKEGIITARIFAENEAARQAIENNIVALKENFNNQEIKVDAIEVLVSAHEFFGQNENSDLKKNRDSANDSKGKPGINSESDDAVLSEEETIKADILKQQGNTVNYSI